MLCKNVFEILIPTLREAAGASLRPWRFGGSFFINFFNEPPRRRERREKKRDFHELRLLWKDEV
ncbi:MAG: hypothetical protein V7K54_01195 [Nostoc sp.]